MRKENVEISESAIKLSEKLIKENKKIIKDLKKSIREEEKLSYINALLNMENEDLKSLIKVQEELLKTYK